MNNTYSLSYVEVLEILKHIPKEDYEKIPKEKIEFYENNKDKNYIYIYNPVNPKIFRVAVAGDRAIFARIKGHIHLPDKIGIHDVVRIKDKIAVVVIPACFRQAVE